MFQCSGSSSVCLTTFLLKVESSTHAAVACVETPFPNTHRWTAWPEDMGLLDWDRPPSCWTALQVSAAPSQVIAAGWNGRRGRGGGEGLQHSLHGRGSNARELLAITIITYIIYYLHYGMHCCIITIRFNVWYAMKGGYAYPTNCWGWGWGPLFFLAAVYHQFSAPSVPVTLYLLKNDRILNFLSPQAFFHCCGAQK